MNIIDILTEVILGGQNFGPPSFKPRQCRVAALAGKANIFIGIRRAGKTSLLKQIHQSINPAHFAFIDFSDDRLLSMKGQDLGLILEAFVQIKKSKLEALGKILWLFDEIQSIPKWEYFINRLIADHNNLVFITGSSAKLLSKEIGTVMRGRALTTEVFPLSFAEICEWEELPTTPEVDTEDRVLLEERFKRSLREGTFPEIVLTPQEHHRAILQDYYHAIYYRDIVDRFNPSNPNAVKIILKTLIHQIAQPYSINKLHDKLKSMGYAIQKELIHDALTWFNDAYLLFSVPLFTPSIHKQNTNPKKLYCMDNGIVNSVSGTLLESRGQLLENFVFGTLRRKSENIFYYKNSQGYELDFVIQNVGSHDEILCVQVCESLQEEKTRTREVRGLVAALHDFKIKKGYIVTLNETETIEHESKEISVMPAWRWALTLGT